MRKLLSAGLAVAFSFFAHGPVHAQSHAAVHNAGAHILHSAGSFVARFVCSCDASNTADGTSNVVTVSEDGHHLQQFVSLSGSTSDPDDTGGVLWSNLRGAPFTSISFDMQNSNGICGKGFGGNNFHFFVILNGSDSNNQSVDPFTQAFTCKDMISTAVNSNFTRYTLTPASTGSSVSFLNQVMFVIYGQDLSAGPVVHTGTIGNFMLDGKVRPASLQTKLYPCPYPVYFGVECSGGTAFCNSGIPCQ